MRRKNLKPEFVEYIPENLDEGTIYISIKFTTAAHKCCCGCGNEVITPISPTDWELTFDGDTVSLDPSIGNWGFDCKSHYWIIRNKIRWARRWSSGEIEGVRAYEKLEKDRYFGKTESEVSEDKPQRKGWRKLRKWWK